MLNGKIDRDSNTPLFVQLSDVIREHLKTEEAFRERKLPTEFELAKLFDVSRVTVSHALEILESEQLVCRIKKRGTFLSSAVGGFDPQNKQRAIGALFPDKWEKLENDIKTSAEKLGFRFICRHFKTSDLADEEAALKKMVRQCAGLTLHPSGEQDDKELLRKLVDSGYPTVFFGSYFYDLPCNSVTVDHFETSFRIGEMMAESGAKAPCLIASPLPMKSFKMRALGFREAMREAGVPLPPEAQVDSTLSKNPKAFVDYFLKGGFDSIFAVTNTDIAPILKEPELGRVEKLLYGTYSQRIEGAPPNVRQFHVEGLLDCGTPCVELLAGLLRSKPGAPFKRVSILPEIVVDKQP